MNGVGPFLYSLPPPIEHCPQRFRHVWVVGLFSFGDFGLVSFFLPWLALALALAWRWWEGVVEGWQTRTHWYLMFCLHLELACWFFVWLLTTH